MRVVIFIHSPKDPKTAVYKHTRDRQAALIDNGHQVEIVSAFDFAITHRIGARFNPLVFPLLVAWWLIRRRGQFDVAAFHSYSGWMVNVLRPHVRSLFPAKTVTTFHGLESLFFSRQKQEMERANRRLSLRYRLVNGALMNFMLRTTCRGSDLVVCLNSQEARYLEANRWADSHSIRQLANCVPNVFLRDREHRRKASRLLFVGQWLDMKGTRYLADAFTRLSREESTLELWCAGTLADSNTVLSRFPADVRPKVRVWPRVDQPELLDLYAKADMFVFPTLSEGFSTALLEAMASALPIVTTPVGAACDILLHGTSVIFVPQQQSESLANAIRSLLVDHELRTKLGHNAHLCAASFTSTSVSDYVTCFVELAEGSHFDRAKQ